jgi:hypothetical protein
MLGDVNAVDAARMRNVMRRLINRAKTFSSRCARLIEQFVPCLKNRSTVPSVRTIRARGLLAFELPATGRAEVLALGDDVEAPFGPGCRSVHSADAKR